MDAPLIIGLLSAFGFFPGVVFTLVRDEEDIITILLDIISSGYTVSI